METSDFTNSEQLLCTLHSNDANEQAANLVNWQQEFDQISRGSFHGVINELNFSNIHVFREDTSHGLRQQCRIEKGGVWLGFSADDEPCRINNTQTDGKRFLCRSGDQDFELLTPDDYSIYGLVLHASLFEQLERQGEEMQILKADHGLWLDRVPSPELTRFRQYLAILLQYKGVRWSRQTQERILEDALLNLLSQAQFTQQERVSPQHRQRIMHRVKQYLTDSRLKSPVTIGEICSAVHVSRRTLQYTFVECLGLAPKQYIQITRLNQVRRALLNSNGTQTVSEIAFDYGFFHLGQFSLDYKKLFGETPMTTRKST
jgi:AraC family ethanolamine operon transcriptional activator